MALIRESPIIGPISGALGGCIAARTKQGPVLKHRPARINRPTAAALAARASFTTATRAWAQLSDQERAAWNDFARARPLANRLHVPRLLTGFQWFMKGGTFQWAQTANGIILYAGVSQLWEWDWTTETLTFPSSWDIYTTAPPSGIGYGALSPVLWTSAQKTLGINVAGARVCTLDVTSTRADFIAFNTRALASSSSVQTPTVATATNTYFQAWKAATAKLETYMAFDAAGLMTLAGTIANAA